jgi:hypothetical protein
VESLHLSGPSTYFISHSPSIFFNGAMHSIALWRFYEFFPVGSLKNLNILTSQKKKKKKKIYIYIYIYIYIQKTKIHISSTSSFIHQRFIMDST